MQILSYAWVLHTAMNTVVRGFGKTSYNPCQLSRIREFYVMKQRSHKLPL